MARIESINDLAVLDGMLESTENPEQRSAIRKRILEIKKKQREATEKNLTDLAARREQRISDKLHESNVQKQRIKETYNEMAKTGEFKKDVYTGGNVPGKSSKK